MSDSLFAALVAALLVAAPLSQAADDAPVSDAASQEASLPEESLSPEQKQFFEKLQALDWIRGPKQVPVGGNSTLEIPEGYVFLDSKNTDEYLELTQNIPSGREVLVAPEGLDWAAYLSFDEEGYVKDDEKIDAPELLKTLKESNEAGNEERQRRGWPALHLTDWAVPPKYNPETKRLEWATMLESEGNRSVNFFTKVLARRGYTSVVLVSDPDDLQPAESALNTVLNGYAFNEGERYADWKPGDKVAEYGLAALVVGGAAALATKKGFWGAITAFLAATWKFLAAALVAVGAWLKKRFGAKE